MYEIKSLLNPAIFKSPTTGKTYIVSGNQPWIEISENTTLNEVRWTPAYEPEKALTIPSEKLFEVKGSKGNKYSVKCAPGGVWSCNCLGFGFRGKCKHVTKLRKSDKN